MLSHWSSPTRVGKSPESHAPILDLRPSHFYDVLVKELLAITVYVDDPFDVARCYARRLGLRPLTALGGGPVGGLGVVVMGGQEAPPWLVLVARCGAGSVSNELPGVPSGRGVRALTCATDDVDSDAGWLEARGLNPRPS